MLNFNMKGGAFWRRKSRRGLLVAASLAIIAAAPARAETLEVTIDNFAFTPQALTAPAGTAIVFRNRDDIPHSIVDSNGAFRSKALDTDDTFTFTFAKAGTYEYFCGLHPQMKGSIIVTP